MQSDLTTSDEDLNELVECATLRLILHSASAEAFVAPADRNELVNNHTSAGLHALLLITTVRILVLVKSLLLRY